MNNTVSRYNGDDLMVMWDTDIDGSPVIRHVLVGGSADILPLLNSYGLDICMAAVERDLQYYREEAMIEAIETQMLFEQTDQ